MDKDKVSRHWIGDPSIRFKTVVKMVRPATWAARDWESFLAVVAADYKFLVWTAESAVVNFPSGSDKNMFEDMIASVLDVLRQMSPPVR